MLLFVLKRIVLLVMLFEYFSGHCNSVHTIVHFRQLEADRDELEAHRDMDEQMLEEQKLVEKALLGEIEGLHIRINEVGFQFS